MSQSSVATCEYRHGCLECATVLHRWPLARYTPPHPVGLVVRLEALRATHTRATGHTRYATVVRAVSDAAAHAEEEGRAR